MNQGLGDAINRKQLRQFRLYMLVGECHKQYQLILKQTILEK